MSISGTFSSSFDTVQNERCDIGDLLLGEGGQMSALMIRDAVEIQVARFGFFIICVFKVILQQFFEERTLKDSGEIVGDPFVVPEVVDELFIADIGVR